MRTLGQRALSIAQQELELGVREHPAGSNTGPKVREYLAPCVRDVVTSIGETIIVETKRLNLVASAWCMAFASFCHAQALRSSERPAHGYRAGVLEAVADVRIGEGYTGRWLGIEDVRAGVSVPRQGDLAVYSRAIDGRSETSWWRHVSRIESWHGSHYFAIGGNELGRVRRAKHMVAHSRLLGFILYPDVRKDGRSKAAPSRPMLSDEERQDILASVAVSLDGILRDSIWRR